MLRKQIQELINNKTKPSGALGLLKEVALQVALILNTATWSIQSPHLIVFAADHALPKPVW